VGSVTTDAIEAPSALADGAEARIAEGQRFGEERASAAKLAVSAISEGDSFSPTGAPAYAESINTNNKQSQSRPAKP
jgi:hypothetical protein